MLLPEGLPVVLRHRLAVAVSVGALALALALGQALRLEEAQALLLREAQAVALAQRLALALPITVLMLAAPLLLDAEEAATLLVPLGGVMSLAAFKVSGERAGAGAGGSAGMGVEVCQNRRRRQRGRACTAPQSCALLGGEINTQAHVPRGSAVCVLHRVHVQARGAVGSAHAHPWIMRSRRTSAPLPPAPSIPPPAPGPRPRAP